MGCKAEKTDFSLWQDLFFLTAPCTTLDVPPEEQRRQKNPPPPLRPRVPLLTHGLEQWDGGSVPGLAGSVTHAVPSPHADP